MPDFILPAYTRPPAAAVLSHDVGLLFMRWLPSAFVAAFESLPDVLRAEIESGANGEKGESPMGIIAKQPLLGFLTQTLGATCSANKLVLKGLHRIFEDSAH
jgi:hypothetical protein